MLVVDHTSRAERYVLVHTYIRTYVHTYIPNIWLCGEMNDH